LAVIFVEIWSWFSFKIMVKLFLFSVLCAVFSLSCGSDVIVLTDEDFNARLASYDLALVKFFCPMVWSLQEACSRVRKSGNYSQG
jgi:hypothetical protein